MPNNARPWSRARVNTAAVAIMLGIAALLALQVWLGGRIGALYGPSKLVAAADGSIYALSHGRLHRFTADGARMSVEELSAYRIDPLLSDFAVVDQDLYAFADSSAKAIFLCSRATRRCGSLSATLEREIGGLKGAAKLFVDRGNGRIYVADTGNHRLIVLGLDGKVLDATKSGGRRFYFPNQITLFGNHELVVADTYRRRLLKVGVENDRVGSDRGSLNTDFELDGRLHRVSPSAFLRDTLNRWWIINAGDQLKSAELIIVDKGAEPPRRVLLADRHDPVSVIQVGDEVLAADPTSFRIFRVSLDGDLRGEFGDTEFRQELAAMAASARWYVQARSVCLAGLVFLLIAGLVVAGKGERGGDSKLLAVPAPASKTGTGAEVPAEIVWVPRPAAGLPSERRIWQTGLALAVAYLLFAVSVYIVVPSLKPSLLWLVFVACSAVIAAVFLAMLSFRNQLQLRIGSDGRSVVIGDAVGEIARCALGVACASGTRLLLDRRLVLLRTAWGSDLFEREAFRVLIFDRLAPSHRLGRLQFDLHLFRIAHPATAIGRVLIGLGVLAALAAMFWPILGRFFSD